MTDEQKAARKKSAESGKIRWIKDHYLRTKDDGEDYVFISYKSDDYEEVLDNIVYNACKKYGLRVYFDTAFDDNSDSWITQYYENMCSEHCKAFIAFIDDAYYSSYATLLEVMSSKTGAAGGDFQFNSMTFVPINLDDIHEIEKGGDDNTGLGTRRFKNGKINKNAIKELKQFNDIFDEISDPENHGSKELQYIYKRKNDTQPYNEETKTQKASGSIYLKVQQCRKLMEKIIPDCDDNSGENKEFVEVIHDQLKVVSSVFGKVVESESKDSNNNDSALTTAKIEKKPQIKENQNHKDDENSKLKETKGKISFKDFVKKYDNNSFKKDTFVAIKLAGTGEYEKYTSEFYDSTFALVWSFIEKQLTEKGMSYIQLVNSKNSGKNPPFLTCEEYQERKKGGQKLSYKNLDLEGLEGYCMNRNYSQYDWINAVLKNRMNELGLPLDKFYFEYYTDEAAYNNDTNFVEVTEGEDSGETDIIKSIITEEGEAFKYTLWGETYTSAKLSTMMHEAFDIIAQRYSDKVDGMAHTLNITSVAAKDDVDNKLLPKNKLNYFMAKREHTVNGKKYYVSTRYNRSQGIEQIKKMMSFCEGNADSFKIIAEPPINSH